MLQKQSKIIHIEDEPAALKLLEGIVKKYLPKTEYYASASTLKEGKKLILEQDFDLLFLDLQLSDGDGMDLIREYPEIAHKTILCTADDSKGIEAIKAGVFYYILKPINISEVIEVYHKYLALKVVKKEEDKINLFENKLIIPDSNGLEIVPVETIVRLEAEQNYTRIFLDSGNEILISKTLKTFEDTLEKYFFLRIHRSHLINANFIKRVNKSGGGSVELTTGESFKLSQSGRDELRDKLKF